MREPHRPLAQARERRAHRSRDRVRPQARHRLRVGLAGATDAAVAQSLRQPVDQQRVATGRAVTRLGEGCRARRAAVLGDHGRCGLRRQRRELDRRRERSPAQGTTGRRRSRPLSHQQQRRHAVDAVREELHEPDRGAVGPVQIIDDEQLRPLCRQRCHEPVQTMEDSERGVGRAAAARRRRAARSAPPAPRLRSTSGCALRPTCRAASAPAVAAPPPTRTRAPIRTREPRNGEVACLRRVTGRNQKAGLADARRSLHDDRASRARDHLVERIGDRAQVALALVEPAAHARRRV